MTISRDAFMRSLPAAVDHAPFVDAGAEIRSAAAATTSWRIVLTPLADLAFGPIALPRQRVEIFLTGYDAPGRRRFLERFELYYRRAGG
jgi:hypothetical protein